ncbi:hypothetical protein M434DRAFT_26673 [Hypoxylon sp. CO27-5]|nr:hypothetical protein M434DRAFT_26673 [Hypoxylon sp. CO27-5]
MEFTFTSHTTNPGNADGATSTTATSRDGGRASLPKAGGVYVLPIRSASRSSSASTGSSTATLKSTTTVDSPKRKRSLSETPEDERPAKKLYIPARQVVFEDPIGPSVTIHFQGYINIDPYEEGYYEDGIPEDIDAGILELVEQDPEARYNHPWVDIPGIIQYVLEGGLEEETAGIHDDTDEGLCFLAEVYGEREYGLDPDDYSDDSVEDEEDEEDEEDHA